MEDSSKLPIKRVDYLDDKIDEIYTSIDNVDAYVNTLDETLTKRIDEVDSKILSGDICYSFRTSKTGWLLCNGQAVSRTDYKDLFAVIGTTYGGGDGSTTFNLPNCSGKFLQMDTSKTIGTSVAAGLPDPQLEFLFRQDSTSSGSYASEYGHDGRTASTPSNTSGTDEYMVSEKNYANTNKWADVRVNNTIYGNSDTVQPPAIIVNYFIKY